MFIMGMPFLEDSAADGDFVRYVRGVYFYAPGARLPYIGYTYNYRRECEYAHRSFGDAMLCVLDVGNYASGGDGRFVDSAERPFYLERDQHDGDLGRLAVTFVPSVEGPSWMPEPAARFDLEVVNRAGASVGVQIKMMAARFCRPIGGGRRDYSGIAVLRGGERHVFELDVYGVEDSSEDGRFVDEFEEVYFYVPGADAPYVRYALQTCARPNRYLGEDIPCVYEPGEGRKLWEKLFVETPDRPFHLERVAGEGDRARVVITSVPAEDSGVGGGD